MCLGSLFEWSRFDAEFDLFREYAFAENSDPIAKGRGNWGPWKNHDACTKICDNLKVLLERVAPEHPGEDPTFAWLLDISDEVFDTNFDTHLDHLRVDRKNVASTRAQTMRSFKRPLKWATKAVAEMTRPERTAFCNEYANFCTEVSSNAAPEKKKRAIASKLKDALNPPMGLSEYMSKVQAHVETVVAAIGTGGTDDTAEARSSALVLDMSTMGRRATMTYKLHYAATGEDACHLFDEDLLPNGATVITPAASGDDFLFLTPDEKNHPVAIHSPTTTGLLKHVCGELEFQSGDYVFTQSSVGVKSQHQYFESDSFSTFFKRLTRTVLGVIMTPIDVRKLRARSTMATDVPATVQESVAVGMATSVKRLRDSYSAASLLDGPWLGSQMARYQFDHRFSFHSQDVVVPTPSRLGSTFDFVPARRVRAEGQASVLLALFVEVSPDLFELSNHVIRAQPALLQVKCSMKVDPASGSQRWRAREYCTAKAKEFFEGEEAQLAGWLASAEAVDCSPHSVTFGQPRDLVLSLEHFAVSEVKKVMPNGDLELHLATEVQNPELPFQAAFEFQHSQQTIRVQPSSVRWPIDLCFKSGRFILSKGARLPCV